MDFLRIKLFTTVWLQWNVKNFGRNLLIGPRSTCQGEGQSALNSGKKVVGGKGGEGVD